MPKSKKNPSDPPKKRGSPSDFKGKRLEFMLERLPAYIQASKNNKIKAQKKDHRTQTFFITFFSEYWRRFPWTLPFDDEPADGPPEPEDPADAEAAFTALGLNLTDEEVAKKSAIQSSMDEKIKRWFSRQRPGAIGIQGNPFFEHLAEMRRQDQEGPPKRLADFQFYMRHEDYKDAVVERLEEERGDNPREWLALRCKIAQELLAAEPEEIRKQIKQECSDAHTEDMAAYEAAVKDDGPLDVAPEAQAEARKKFTATVTPLLSGLRAFTGYTINIMAGCVVGNEFLVASSNAGLVNGKDWAEWDPEVYAAASRSFAKFIHAEHMQSISPLAPSGSASAPAPAPIGSASAPAPIGSAFAPAPAPIDLQGLLRLSEPPPNDVEMTPAEGAAPPPPRPLQEDNADIMSGVILSGAPTASTPAPKKASKHPKKVKRTAKEPVVTETALATTPAEAVAEAPPPPSLPPLPESTETWGLALVTPALRGEILAKSKEEQSVYLRKLRRMHSIDLRRENNMAGNRRLIAEMGLKSTAVFLGMKRDAEKEGKGRKKKKAKRAAPGDDEDWGDENDGSDETSDEGSDDEVEGNRSPVRTRGRGRGGKEVASGTSTATTGRVVNAPKWAKAAKAMLLDVGPVQMGEEWTGLLDTWWALEESMGFTTSRKTHPATGRPTAVKNWVKEARKGTPNIGGAEAMAAQWWGWWRAINPSWRLREGELVQEGEGSWDVLRCPGQNGFLNVIVCLKWWRCEMENRSESMEKTSELWQRAVADVRWVLTQMVNENSEEGGEQTGATPTPPPSTPSPLSPPNNGG
ncbi:hypothetical protein C8F04DRAFT_1190785 [Mycena alexandri]|uniref:Uncharacterized protein n=1 Tax=Mycena alexandri TaxID=1745969 RepID=A0AAD6WWS5_9AGAR|nr:hypothetical protein C8F04DRAFT_1190785 [Mycena alexandri]